VYRSDLGSPRPTQRPLQLASIRDDDSLAIRLTGELDLSVSDELDAAIREAEETEVGRIIVDLSGVVFIDSTGLSVLLGARKRMSRRLSFVPSEHEAVMRLLVLTNTDEILR
jgi:anti-sigma B factor antagonist